MGQKARSELTPVSLALFPPLMKSSSEHVFDSINILQQQAYAADVAASWASQRLDRFYAPHHREARQFMYKVELTHCFLSISFRCGFMVFTFATLSAIIGVLEQVGISLLVFDQRCAQR